MDERRIRTGQSEQGFKNDERPRETFLQNPPVTVVAGTGNGFLRAGGVASRPPQAGEKLRGLRQRIIRSGFAVEEGGKGAFQTGVRSFIHEKRGGVRSGCFQLHDPSHRRAPGKHRLRAPKIETGVGVGAQFPEGASP